MSLLCGHMGCGTFLLTHGQWTLLSEHMDSGNCSVEKWKLFCEHMDNGRCSVDAWTVDTALWMQGQCTPLCRHMDTGQRQYYVDTWTVNTILKNTYLNNIHIYIHFYIKVKEMLNFLTFWLFLRQTKVMLVNVNVEAVRNRM